MGKSRITPEQWALRTKLGEMMAWGENANRPSGLYHQLS
jgi:hypothetical protein